MAGSMNRVTLIGNVGKDPESRSFNNGGKVVNLTLATSETWKDGGTGERKEKTEWHTIAVFQDGLTDLVERYVRKGSKIMVEGKLQTRKWQDQAGQDRYSTEVVLQGFDAKILLLNGKQDGGEPRGSTRQQAEAREAPGKSAAGYPGELDDDVPF